MIQRWSVARYCPEYEADNRIMAEAVGRIEAFVADNHGMQKQIWWAQEKGVQ